MSVNKAQWHVPRSLDEMPQLLFLDFYQQLLLMLPLLIGQVAGSLLAGVGVGMALTYAYGRIKTSQHPRFIIHMAYWYLPSSLMHLRYSPPAHLRLYVG